MFTFSVDEPTLRLTGIPHQLLTKSATLQANLSKELGPQIKFKLTSNAIIVQPTDFLAYSPASLDNTNRPSMVLSQSPTYSQLTPPLPTITLPT